MTDKKTIAKMFKAIEKVKKIGVKGEIILTDEQIEKIKKDGHL